MLYLLAIAVGLLLWKLASQGGRLQLAENRLQELDCRLDHLLAGMARRVYALEQLTLPQQPMPPPVPAATAQPSDSAPEAAPAAPPRDQSWTNQAPLPEPAAVPPQPVSLPPVPAPPAAAPAAVQPVAPRPFEWEAALGSNWLNKAGVVLLMVGLALFLGYSFAHLGPAGRVMLGVALSLGMLGAGVFSEHRPGYRVFGQGLIGGGWAGLYFTTYAAHGVADARIIASPILATVLLVLVGVGMVAHSLRYRSEAVTGLATLLAFLALGVSGASTFSLGASVLLAAGLLWLTHRFGWSNLAFAGRPATYGLFLLHTLRVSGGDVAVAQSLLLVYWVLFEGFDLLRARAGRSDNASLLQFPTNALSLTSLSFLVWSQQDRSWAPALICAGAFLLSALARGALFGNAGGRTLNEAFREGSYLLPLAAAAPLVASAILDRFSGLQASLLLVAEAQLLFLAACLLRRTFLNGLSSALYYLLLLQALWAGQIYSHVTLPGHNWREFSLLSLLCAALFYLNRAVRPRWSYYGHVAAALLAGVLWAEVPREWLAPAWLGLAAVLAFLALRSRPAEFRYPAAAVGSLAAIPLLAFNLDLGDAGAAWAPQLAAALVLTFLAGLVHFSWQFSPEQRAFWRFVCAAAGALTFAALLRNVTPEAQVALAWAGFAVLVLEVGLLANSSGVRLLAHLLGLSAFLRVLVFTAGLEPAARDLTNWLSGSAAVAAALLWLYRRAGAGQGWEVQARRLHLYAVGALAVQAVWLETSTRTLGLGLSLLMLLLFALGRGLALPDLRLQAYLLGPAAALAGLVSRLQPGVSLPDADLWMAAFPMLALYLLHLWAAHGTASDHSALDHAAPPALTVFSTLTLMLLIGQEAATRLLTVAWGVQGLALLAAGFCVRFRSWRLSGLAVLGWCIAKLFFWDLRHLDTPHRIVSFVVLGVFLIGVSWFYARFRGELGRYFGSSGPEQ